MFLLPTLFNLYCWFTTAFPYGFVVTNIHSTYCQVTGNSYTGWYKINCPYLNLHAQVLPGNLARQSTSHHFITESLSSILWTPFLLLNPVDLWWRKEACNMRVAVPPNRCKFRFTIASLSSFVNIDQTSEIIKLRCWDWGYVNWRKYLLWPFQSSGSSADGRLLIIQSYRDRRQDVAQEIEGTKQQLIWWPDLNLLLSFSPFSVWRPGDDHGTHFCSFTKPSSALAKLGNNGRRKAGE